MCKRRSNIAWLLVLAEEKPAWQRAPGPPVLNKNGQWSLGRNLNKETHVGSSCSELSGSDDLRVDVAVRVHRGRKRKYLGHYSGSLHCREFINKIHGGTGGAGSSPGLGNCCTLKDLSLVVGRIVYTPRLCLGKGWRKELALNTHLQRADTCMAIQARRMDTVGACWIEGGHLTDIYFVKANFFFFFFLSKNLFWKETWEMPFSSSIQ